MSFDYNLRKGAIFMNFFQKYKKLLSILLIFFISLPFPLILSSSIVYADNGNNGHPSWLKGILLILISFIINNFIEKNNTIDENNGGIIDDNPLLDDLEGIGENLSREVLGYHVNWLNPNASSFDALKTNYNQLDYIAPFWYTINPDGGVEERYGGHQYEVDSFARTQGIEILPLINNNQQNNMILVDPTTRTRAVDNIINLVEKYNYDGVNIDFESIPPWTRNGYTSFIQELSKKLRERDKKITVAVFPKIDVSLELQGAYDYAALEPYIDRMVIMTYDKHWSTGPAGPIAPINWVEENIKYTLEYIPAEKLLLGIANYGYDWNASLGKDISAKEAQIIARENGAEIKWDNKSQSPYFYYQDSNNIKHEVWFESSAATAFKIQLVNKYNLQGIAIWRLGNGTAEFWNKIKKHLR